MKRGFRRRHLTVLQRRANFLAACEATGSANSYEKAERAALDAALGELRTVVTSEPEQDSDDAVSTTEPLGGQV